MSFSIYYRTQFIAVRNQIIPVMETGCSNCYEGRSGRRRARDWGSLQFYADDSADGLPTATTAARLATFIETERKVKMARAAKYVLDNPETKEWATYSDEKWGWHMGIALGGKKCAAVTFANYRNFLLNAAKNAETVEELAAQRIWVSVSGYNSEGYTVKNLTVRTTEALELALVEFAAEYGNDKIRVVVSGDGLDKPKLAKPRTPKPELTGDYYVLQIPSGYVVKKTARGIYTNLRQVYAKRFATEKLAEKWRESILRRDAVITKVD